jgi:hypothetical protein
MGGPNGPRFGRHVCRLGAVEQLAGAVSWRGRDGLGQATPLARGHGVAMATLCAGDGGPARTRTPRRRGIDTGVAPSGSRGASGALGRPLVAGPGMGAAGSTLRRGARQEASARPSEARWTRPPR